MAIRARRPTPQELARLLEQCRTDSLTYAPSGGSLGGVAPAHLRPQRWTTTVTGSDAYARAVTALHDWAVHRASGLDVLTDGPITVGTNVALSAPLPIGFVDATCRIVAVIDEPDRFGFAYGTLSVHPEQGEESFVVTRRDDGSVEFAVHAVSRPAHPLARLVPAVAHRLQAAAVKRYLDAMRRAVEVG